MLRFLHTADWQLGKPYARLLDADKRARLRRQRLETIGRLGEVAREQRAAFILVAGDLFDSITPTRADVSSACSAIGALELPVLVIPGNHDHGGPGSVWHEPWFRTEQAQLAPNLVVLLERAPQELPQAVLLPCPLLRKAEPVDPTAWIRALDFTAPGAAWSDRPRLVLAHGSIQGFGAEEGETDDENPPVTANRIDLAALPEAEIDYIALGDWHGLKQVGPRAWYAGCHETDRFPRSADYRSGQVLLVSVERGAPPEVVPVSIGAVGWHQIQHRFGGDDDLRRLEERIGATLGSRSGEDLLLLELDGSLSLAAAGRLRDLLERLEARLLRLKLRDHTSVAPDPDELRQLTERAGDPLVARVAQRLRQLAAAEAASQNADPASPGASAELARMALRELHRACVQGS